MSAHVVGLDKVSRKLRAMNTVLQRSMVGALRSEGRIIAVSFARSSQPYGNDSKARDAGRNATARDIAKVYIKPSKAYGDIADRHYQALFWKAVSAKEWDVAALILNQFGSSFRGVRFGAFDPLIHRENRNGRTGRVSTKRPLLIVTDPAKLDSYFTKRKDNVGTAKGAWADVARWLGGVRGAGEDADISASWFTHKGVGLGRVEWGGTNTSPWIKLTSVVDYAEQVLDAGDRAAAAQIAHSRVQKQLQMAINAEARKLADAA